MNPFPGARAARNCSRGTKTRQTATRLLPIDRRGLARVTENRFEKKAKTDSRARHLSSQALDCSLKRRQVSQSACGNLHHAPTESHRATRDSHLVRRRETSAFTSLPRESVGLLLNRRTRRRPLEIPNRDGEVRTQRSGRQDGRAVPVMPAPSANVRLVRNPQNRRRFPARCAMRRQADPGPAGTPGESGTTRCLCRRGSDCSCQ